MGLPVLTFFKHPDKMSPVNAPMVWGFTASFRGTSASIDTSNLIVDLKILDQNVSSNTVLETVGRFHQPPRGDRYYFDPSTLLKSYVTYPYNSATVSHYVNETSGFLTRLAPETEGIVRYEIDYGLEYDPNFSFSFIDGPGGFARFFAVSTNVFASVGDVINIVMDSGAYSYFNGTASITSIGTVLGEVGVTTDMVFDPSLPSLGFYASGRINNVQHMVGNFPNYYGFNGTRQYYERDTDFLEKYGFQGFALQTFNFLADYGQDSNHCIPIRPYQGERARCFMDFYGHTVNTLATNGLYSSITTYDTNGATLSVTASALNTTDSITGVTYSASCFTVTVFDNLNTIPIVDGYKYKFKMYYLNGISAPVDYAELWYIGQNKCSAYQNYRIKFLNRQGSWSYWNFNKDMLQASNIERTEYIRPMGYEWTLFSNDSDYSTSGLRGSAILSSKVYQTFTLNSDWVTEDAYKFLAQLVESPEVYLYFDNDDATTNFSQLGYGGYPIANGGVLSNGTNIPLIMTDNSYSFKTANRETLFNLQVSFKYAFETNVQNQ